MIFGERGSGKTSRLIKELLDYLNQNPEGVAIFIVPSERYKGFLPPILFKHNRIKVMTWDEFTASKKPYPLKKSKSAVFIDQMDIILKNQINRHIRAFTLDSEVITLEHLVNEEEKAFIEKKNKDISSWKEELNRYENISSN